jgi:hypothetical protein
MAVNVRKTTLKRVGKQVNFVVGGGIAHYLKASGSAFWTPRRSVATLTSRSMKSDDC